MQIQIRILGTDQQELSYRRSIEAVLRDIRNTHVGRIVIRHIELANHPVIIIPYSELRRSRNGASALAMNASSAGSFSANRVGSGTGTRVFFSPDRLPNNGNATEVLLHELAHALRFVTGTARLTRQDGNIGVVRIASFTNVEEFFTITTGNVLSSELRRPLRGNHGRWPLRDTSIYNVPPFSTRLQQICDRMPSFAKDMANIPEIVAPFNPFRDVIQSRRNSNLSASLLNNDLWLPDSMIDSIIRQ
jgi:hypothetical protein